MEFWFLQWLYHAGVSVSVQAEETTETEEAAETDSSAESEDDLRILFDQAVEDAMIAEDGEILPVVSLDEESLMQFIMKRKSSSIYIP